MKRYLLLLTLPSAAMAMERTTTSPLETQIGGSGRLNLPICNPTQALNIKDGRLACLNLRPSNMHIRTDTKKLCRRGGQHQIVATCKANEELLACSGGPGDQGETYEYWVLIPDYRNKTCTGYIGNPACFDNAWSQTFVNAHCYDPTKTVADPVDDTSETIVTVPWQPHEPSGDGGGGPGDGGDGGGDAGDGGDAGGDGDGDGGGGDGDGGGGDGDGGGGDGGA